MVLANAGLILVALIIGVFLYPALPAQIATHWNMQGVADGVMPKFWGLFLVPFIMVITLLLSVFLPLIDPMRENVQAFRRSYQNFFFWIGVFLFYLFVLMIGWNVGWRFNFTMALIPAMAALFFIVGSFLGRSKRNWFVGIRTPWTMESEDVWDKTNQLGGLMFQVSAAVMLGGIIFPQYLLYFIVVPIGITVVATTVYSYIEFRRERV